MMRAGRHIRLSLAIAAAIVDVDGLVLHGRAEAEKVPLEEAIKGLEPHNRCSHHEDKIGKFLKKVHSTYEKIFVPSVKKVMDLLVETLKQIPVKQGKRSTKWIRRILPGM